MARQRTEQPAPVVEPAAASTESVTEQPAPVVELHTPASLGYKPGDHIPLHHLLLIGTPIQ